MPLTSHMDTYFEIKTDDITCSDRWHLDMPRDAKGIEIDPRVFVHGETYNGVRPASVAIDAKYPGREVQFNLAAFDMPVVSASVAGIIANIAPASIERFVISIPLAQEEYVILNVTQRARCVDEQRTEYVAKWMSGDMRPDKVGHYKALGGLQIDPCRTHGLHVFRVEGWVIALVVSERVKLALEKVRDLGVTFVPVTKGDSE